MLEFRLVKQKDSKLLKSLGLRIKQLRLDSNLTQTDLAFKAGIEQYHVSKIENGTNSASITTLNSIANALGVSLVELLTFDKVPRK